MSYKYETHLHTAESSACAVSKGAEYIKPYILPKKESLISDKKPLCNKISIND